MPISQQHGRDDNAASLSASQAAQRLQQEGANALPGGQRRGNMAIVVEALREPMFMLLLAAGTLYVVFGDLQEGLSLFGVVVVTLALTVYQEGKTERAIEALRDLTSPRALVIRDGQPLRIAGCDVVRGDLLRLNEGDRVPADAWLLQATGFGWTNHCSPGRRWRWAKWQRLSPSGWL
jgi:P-type Ca2+ transporter type 2C